MTSLRVWNYAGMNYLAFFRVAHRILEVVPSDMRERCSAESMAAQHFDFELLDRQLRLRSDLDYEDVSGDALGALWSWRMDRTVSIDRGNIDPDLWFWCDGVNIHAELIAERLVEDSQRGAAGWDTGKMSLHEFFVAIEGYRLETLQTVMDRLYMIQVDDDLRLEWERENLAFLRTPFMESIASSQSEETDWDMVRDWYRKFELAKRGAIPI